MFVQCTRCLNTFDAAAPNAPCPRCASAGAPTPSAGAVPKTMAVDASVLADVLRGSIPSAAGNPFTSTAPNASPQPFQAPHPPTQSGPFHPPPTYAPAQPPMAHAHAGIPQTAQQPFAAAQYGAPYGAVQPYAPAAGAAAAPSDRDLSGHAIISVVIASLAFLGACNLVGLAGVVLGLMAHNDANQGRPGAAQRTKTARLVSVVALVLTVLAWGAGAAFLLLVKDA